MKYNKYKTLARLIAVSWLIITQLIVSIHFVLAQTVVCPTDTDLGTYDCTNIFDIPPIDSFEDLIASPYNIQITGIMPMTNFIIEDSDVIFYCEENAREVTRSVIIYNDVNFNFVYDAGEEIEICTFTISTIADTIAPSFTAPNDTTVSCFGGYQPDITGLIVVDEACPLFDTQYLIFGDSFSEGACAGEGIVIRSWVAVDPCGNISQPQTQEITIIDDDAPTFTVPPDITLPCGSDPLDDILTGEVVDILDACGTVSISSAIVDSLQNTLCLGSNTYTKRWEAIDDCGNSTIADQTVIIECAENCFTEVCDCENNIFTAYAAAEPGTYNEIDHVQLYLLTDSSGNILSSSMTGNFPNLMSNTDYSIYAVNVLNTDLMNFQNDIISGSNINDLINLIGNFANYCYDLNSNSASYNCVCPTFVCPTIGDLNVTPIVCEGNTFDILVSNILNTEFANNSETDFNILIGYYNGNVSNPNPYTTAPDGFFNEGNPITPSNGSISITVTLPEGMYGIVAYLTPNPLDENCQPLVFDEITIHPNPVVDLGDDLTACEGESVELDAANESSMTIWSPTGETTSAITVSTSGTYQVNVEDTNGCTASDEIMVTFITAFQVDNPVSICADGSYTLPDGMTVSTAGSYSTTLNSSQGCDSIITTMLSINNVLTSDNPISICEGQNYTLPDGNSVSTAGTYPVTLTSTQGCDSIITTILSINNVLTSDNPISICEGEIYTLPDGNLVSTAGTYPVTLTSSQGCDSVITTILSLTDVFTSENQISICTGENYTLPDGNIVSTAGTYPLTYTSSQGCDSLVSIILTVNDLPIVTISGNLSICSDGTGASNQDEFTALIASEGFESYSWNTGTTNAGIVTAEGGDYTVTVTNVNSCSNSATVTVVESSCAVCSTPSITANAICSEGTINEYAIQITEASGGFTGNLIINDGTSEQTWSGTTLTFGPYTYAGDESTVSFVVSDSNDSACMATFEIEEISCATEICDCDNGIFTAYAIAEPGSYETLDYTNVYLLTDDSGAILAVNYTGLFPNLTANIAYTIYAANVKNEDLANFEMDLSSISAVENQTGNFAMYCYELNPNVASYTCTCDGFICPLIGEIETSTTACVGNLVDVAVNGISNTLQSENGETTFDILIGAYNGSVANPNPYITEPLILLNQGNALTPDNGTVTLNSVGPLIDSGIFTVVAYLSPTPTGDVTCQPVAVIEVTVNEAPNEPGQSEPITACEGEPVVFSAPAGYDYLWATDATLQNVTVFNTTSLPVTITNAEGCAQTLIYEAIFNETPNEPQPDVINACISLDYFTILAPPNYTYLWQDGSTGITFEANQSGTYILTIFNTEGCSQDLIYEVNLEGLSGLEQPPAVSICDGESITLTGPDNFNYVWFDGSTLQSVQVSSPGNYALTVLAGYDCAADLIFVVNAGGNLNEPNPTPNEICEGEQTILTAPTGYNYLWYDGSTTSSVNVSSAGTYTLEISDNTGCSQTLNYVVNGSNAPNQPQPQAITACQGDVVNLQAPTGFSYIWDDGTQSSNYNVTESGSYNVTIGNGCEQVLTFEVTFAPLPTISFQTIDPTVCGANNGIIQLSFTGIENGIYNLRYKGGEFNNIQVNNGSANITGLSPGIYNFITITDENGCEALTDGLVEINESGEILPPPSLSSGSTFCESNNVETITVTGEPFANFTWYSDATLSNVLNLGDNYLTNGVDETVYVTQKLPGSCESEALEVQIIFNPAESLAAQSYLFCADEIGSDIATVDLTIYESDIGNSGGTWFDGNGDIIDAANYQFSNTGNLSYQINNENGCEATAIVKLKVNTVTPKSINISRCTFENGNLINLVAFAVINGLPDTGAWSTNGMVIDSVETYILMEPMQVFYYDFIDENGCPNQLTANLTLEQAPIIKAKAVCSGTENFDQYFIEVTSVKNVTFNEVIVTDGNTTETVLGNGSITFGPYPHSGVGLTTTTIEAYFGGTIGCSMTLEVLETYCPQPEPCNCANALSPTNAGTILGQAEPGSFKFKEYLQNYVLTDEAGNILQNNHTGLFTDLENGSYNVYAINVEEIDATVFIPALSTLTNISGFIPDKSYDNFCYTIKGPANYEVACDCLPFVCPEIGGINITDAVCEGNTFDISVNGIANLAAQENNETDWGISIGYYNGIVALPDPYNNPPDGLFNGGNAVNTENGAAELTGMGANLLAGRYTIVAYLSDTPDETDCRPMVRLFTEVYDTPQLNPAAHPICEGTTGILTSGVVDGTFPHTIQWTDPAGTNYSVQNFTIHLATQENAGIYQVSVTDVKGCSASESLEVVIVADGTGPFVPVEVCEEIPGGAVEATVNLNEIEALMSASGGTWKDRSGSMVTNPENVFLAGTNQFRFEYFLETQGNCEQEQVMIININSIEVTQDIRSSVCRERAASFDLTAFENEVDLSNGTWSDADGTTIENASAVNLMDGLQFTYTVQDENGCAVPTRVSFSILEDVNLEPIEAMVCNEPALAFDLNAFEIEADLSNGIWQNVNGVPMDAISSVNLFDEDFQLIYSVQDEAGCYFNTAVSFTIKEDAILDDIEATVCNEPALSFDLTDFENEINLSNGVWLDQNENPIENFNNVNLIDEGLQLIYSVQSEDGCYANTPIVFSIKENVILEEIQATVCNEPALNFDLATFANEVNLSNGVWLDQNENPIENLTNVNLIEEELQLIYSVQSEDGCYANTNVVFSIKEDVTLNPIEASVCNEQALAFDLNAFEIEADLTGGVWLDENRNPIENLTSVNLIEAGLQLIYSIQSEDGCYTNTSIVFSIKEDVTLEAIQTSVCNINAISFNLTTFENEINLFNGIWLDQNENPIEDLTNVNLIDAGLQLTYVVQNEDACFSRQEVVFTIQEDEILAPIEAMVCEDAALSFNLTAFANEVNLSDGIWLDQRNNIIQNLANFNLIADGLQLMYAAQNEEGCSANTTVTFTIKEDVFLEDIQASVCNIRALSFNLTVFANEVNLTNGVWLDKNGNLINTNSVNLIEEELQLIYAVQSDDGCYTNTTVLFELLEDENLSSIEATVCNEVALSINLTIYENQIGGIWLDENGIPVDDATNVNLIEEGLQFVYSVQSEEGCYVNTPILFTLKDDIQINAVARCVGESNEEGFVIDVTEITGGYGGNIYQLQVGDVAFMYEGGTATFGPYQFNDGAIEIMASSDEDASCNQILNIAPAYCGESVVYCDCTNLTNPVTVQVMAEPGSYNTNGYSNIYLLTISNGTVIDFNTTGQFSGLLRNTDYYVYASNVEDIDYLIYESALNGALIDDVIQKNGEFSNMCYEVNAGIAQFNENCICVDCEANAGLPTLLEGGLDVVCQGDSIGPFIATDAINANNFSYAWLVTNGAPNYIIDTLIEGSGASFANDFNLESEPGSYCVHGVSIFGDFSLFDKFIADQNITDGAGLLLAIETGQTCADLILDTCIPIEVNANPEADLASSVTLCTSEGGLYPTGIDLNDLIITATEGTTGSWYANFEDSIPIASTIVSAIDKPLGSSTYFFVAEDEGCESIRYVTKVTVLDCTERICNYTLLSSEAVCNTDGTYNLVADIIIEDPLSNEFFLILNETAYGPFTDTDSIGIEQITLEGLTGEAREAEIIIKDRDSNLTFEPTPIFISEIHYQNFGPSEGEGLEITALAGTNLADYSIILYNGNGGAVYNSLTLGSVIADEGNGYGTYVLNFPLQNGPDAIALIDNTNPAYPVVLELISYEGSFFVSDGLAMGMQTDDIGVFEPGEVGESLQLTDLGWIGPVTNTMDSINSNLSLQLEPEQINCTFNYAIEIPSCGACELNPTLMAVDCDLDASTYFLEIAMEASSPIGSQYTVDLSFSGFPVFNYGNFDYDGANAVIGPFQADDVTAYEFLIQDVDSEDCNTTVFFGPYNCLDEPLLLARDAGELPSQTQIVCSNDEIEIKAIGAITTQGTALCYLLHDGSNTSMGNSIAVNKTGKFINDGSLPLNVELCVTAVLGNIANEGAMPTEIYDTSNCTPVVFLKSLQIGSSINCNYLNNTYTIDLSFDGGLPAYNFNEPYLVKNKNEVKYGNTLTTNPIISGKSYNIYVSDANGCTTNYRNEPIICEKLYVSIIAFDAKIGDTGNILDWITEYEIDNRFFTLERSYDGIEYKAIAQKKGQGNSEQINTYQHVDEKVQNGITHYRLMQTAFDGTVNQVGYRAIHREAKLIEIDYLLPNPTTGQLYSGIMIQSKGKLFFEIVDITGKIVEQAEMQVDRGLLELELDVSTYTNGIYFIKVHYGDYTVHQKFIKQ